ncbi:MAG: ComEC/Rec2 family competence protein [Acidobacteriota bacterium]
MSRASQSGFLPCRQPFLYLTAALIAGILTDAASAPRSTAVFAITAISSLASIVFFLLRKNSLATVAILAAVFSIGVSLAFAQRTRIAESRLTRLFDQRILTPDTVVDLTGTLALPPEPAPRVFYLDLEAESARVGDQQITASGRVRLMIHLIDGQSRDEFNRLALDYGSRVKVLVRLERTRSFANPGSTDFNEYLERAGYDLRGTVKSPLLIEHIGQAETHSLLVALYKIRLSLLRAIDARFDPTTAGTLKAMLAGNRYFLDAEVSEKLRESSTFHALSISGMHVGLIAGFVWLLLGGWRQRGNRPMVRTVLSLIILWMYALMVGLAPPVTRATVMISIALAGPLLFRRAASINTVALAAFVILALKPALVADPGFQLSFVAVAAIVAIAVPFVEKLRAIGQWHPTPETSHPPSCSRAVKLIAESLFWDERRFKKEMKLAPISYRPEKSRIARALNLVRVQPLLRAAAILVITSAAIQLATLPLMACYFNRVAPVGVLLNVAAGLLTGLLMLAGMLSLALSWLSSFAASLFQWLAEFFHHLLASEIEPFRWIPGATFRVAHYEGWESALYAVFYAPVAMMIALIDRWQPFRIKRDDSNTALLSRPIIAQMMCIASLIAAIAFVIRPAERVTDGRLKVHFLDVGQGDAALIVFPRGSTMLIDAGGDFDFTRAEADADKDAIEIEYRDSAFSTGEMIVSRFLWANKMSRIDYALATHAHTDHIEGFRDVIRNFTLGQMILARAPADNAVYNRLAETILRRDVPSAAVSAGDIFEIEGVRIEVLWPRNPQGIEGDSGNDDSVVVRLSYGSVSILLAGDIERAAEDQLVRSADLRADILKVPHHGSLSSSTESFIDAVRPRYAVISVGERSRFGHPHAMVVDRYVARGIRLLQTGRDGCVTVETDGESIDVRTFRSR